MKRKKIICNFCTKIIPPAPIGQGPSGRKYLYQVPNLTIDLGAGYGRRRNTEGVYVHDYCADAAVAEAMA
jgi:hypothetical protein